MAEWTQIPDGVTKKILSGGKGDLPEFTPGGKVLFHYRSLIKKDDGDLQLLDDSKKSKKPFELLLGKKFKLDIWETLVKTMRLNEIAEFTCEAQHVASYPVVSKSLRDMVKKEHGEHEHEHHTHHQCGFAAMSQGLGYPDLDEYVKNPKPMVFQLELIKVDMPGTYERDLWSLSLEEKLAFIPTWKEEGNDFYKHGDLENACKKYSQALGSLEQLTTREKPGSEEWLAIEKMKVPLLLNYAQCMLGKKEYYQAVEHLTTVLEKDKDNVKALYRRAKAYHLVFNLESARFDYMKAKQLDSSLTNTIDKELKRIQSDEKKKDQEDKEKFKNAFA